MSIVKEQYALVDRLLFDIKGQDAVSPEEYYQLVEIALYWLDQMEPDPANAKERMAEVIKVYEQHKKDNPDRQTGGLHK